MKKIVGILLAVSAIASVAQPSREDILKLEKMADEGAKGNRVPFVHAMRGDEAADLARKRINAWIRFNMESAIANKAKGDFEKALLDFFTARHTLRDATSPIANDEQGNPAVYRGDIPDDHAQLPNNSWRGRVDQDIWQMFEHSYVPAGDLLLMYGMDTERGPIDRPNQLPRPNFGANDKPSTNATPDAIQIASQGADYEISLPASKLRLVVPKGALVQRSTAAGATQSKPRYFFLEDRANNRVVSGWMEPAQRYKGIHAFWENESKDWTKGTGLPEPQNVTFEAFGKWEAVVYEIPTPIPNATSTNLRAHWVEAGTWIDLHISTTSSRPARDARDDLAGFLKSIQVKQKD